MLLVKSQEKFYFNRPTRRLWPMIMNLKEISWKTMMKKKTSRGVKEIKFKVAKLELFMTKFA